MRRPTRFVSPLALVTVLLLVGPGSLLVGRHGYLEAKAMLAEHLIGTAFDRHLEDGRAHRPWSWADMHPIASLEIPRLGVSRYVLTGGSGESMAFGVGHIDGTAPPNGRGNCVLTGHRDTWLSFVRDIKVGDVVRVRTTATARDWVVDSVRVVHATNPEVAEQTPDDRLSLVTCWPFDGLLRSPWRCVVTCRPRG